MLYPAEGGSGSDERRGGMVTQVAFAAAGLHAGAFGVGGASRPPVVRTRDLGGRSARAPKYLWLAMKFLWWMWTLCEAGASRSRGGCAAVLQTRKDKIF